MPYVFHGTIQFHKKLWNKWIKDICQLNKYRVSRSFKSHLVESAELHVFCDGSETAYGACAYIKFNHENNCCSSILVSSKSRLTPLNNSTLKTIPRIELSSAKLAVDLAHKLKRELGYEFISETFYTDSTTVLKYINNDNARFQRFVANKVTYIRCNVNSNQVFLFFSEFDRLF